MRHWVRYRTEPGLWLISLFFNDTATTGIYTLSLHDALPISSSSSTACSTWPSRMTTPSTPCSSARSEEHTSELQSREKHVCRLLHEKKKKAAPAVFHQETSNNRLTMTSIDRD